MIEKVALRLLSLKCHSSSDLRKKLIRRGFSPEEIEPLLEKYQRLGYLNDNDLAERRTEAYQKRGYGPRWIAGKLREQGLRPSSYSLEDQKAAIARLVKTAPFLRKKPSQQIAALQRRGFDLSAIFAVIPHPQAFEG